MPTQLDASCVARWLTRETRAAGIEHTMTELARYSGQLFPAASLASARAHGRLWLYVKLGCGCEMPPAEETRWWMRCVEKSTKTTTKPNSRAKSWHTSSIAQQKRALQIAIPLYHPYTRRRCMETGLVGSSTSYYCSLNLNYTLWGSIEAVANNGMSQLEWYCAVDQTKTTQRSDGGHLNFNLQLRYRWAEYWRDKVTLTSELKK